MTPSDADGLVKDLGTVHYPGATPEQLRAVRDRLLPYPEDAARQTIMRYARAHPQFLHVEPLIAAIAEAAASHAPSLLAQRRQAEAIERAAFDQQREVIDAEIAKLSDEQWAEWLERVKESSPHGPWYFRKGRNSPSVRRDVYEAMQQQGQFQQAVGRTA